MWPTPVRRRDSSRQWLDDDNVIKLTLPCRLPLPLEIIENIARELDAQSCRATLSSITRCNKVCYHIVTPVLYRVVVISGRTAGQTLPLGKHLDDMPIPRHVTHSPIHRLRSRDHYDHYARLRYGITWRGHGMDGLDWTDRHPHSDAYQADNLKWTEKIVFRSLPDSTVLQRFGMYASNVRRLIPSRQVVIDVESDSIGPDVDPVKPRGGPFRLCPRLRSVCVDHAVFPSDGCGPDEQYSSRNAIRLAMSAMRDATRSTAARNDVAMCFNIPTGIDDDVVRGIIGHCLEFLPPETGLGFHGLTTQSPLVYGDWWRKKDLAYVYSYAFTDLIPKAKRFRHIRGTIRAALDVFGPHHDLTDALLGDLNIHFIDSFVDSYPSSWNLSDWDLLNQVQIVAKDYTPESAAVLAKRVRFSGTGETNLGGKIGVDGAGCGCGCF